MSSAKWQKVCPGEDELILRWKINKMLLEFCNVIPVNMWHAQAGYTKRQLLAACYHNCGNCVGSSNFMGGGALKIAPNETSRCQMSFVDPNTHNDHRHVMKYQRG